MPESSPSWGSVLLAVAAAVGSVGSFYAVFVNRRKPKFEQLLIGAQTEESHANSDKLKAETRSLNVNSDLSLVDGAFRLMDRLEAELKKVNDKCSEQEKTIEKQRLDIWALEEQLGIKGESDLRKGNGKG